MDKREWFKSAKFGMMIHWGLYSLPAGEWKGARMPYIGEWVQQYFRIPNAEYHALAPAFNPILFNADEWVQLAVDAGMKYMVITSKHHDGFAMYHSKVSKLNIVDATPFKRDVIGELAEACRKHGIKFGLYYSQDLDWSEPNGGGYTRGKTWGRGSAGWTNDWDFPDNENKNYTQCYEAKIKPQVKEILTQYGDLCLIWFDTPTTLSLEQSKELADMVHKYQPNCLVNSRIGNGMGDYRSMGDNEIPDETMPEGLFESACTINDTWGYKSFDNNWKSADRIIELKEHLNARGLNYLLNVGPDYLGRIPAPSVEVLRQVGQRLS
ncbi:MAG: alpha-L-fucosidase [Lentisphaerae bacterium]|jgi:alpha-L-fucosidase|nr:alpha-L-fucosidase [Lentisphaerota bacterium]